MSCYVIFDVHLCLCNLLNLKGLNLKLVVWRGSTIFTYTLAMVKETLMFRWGIIFLVIALIAAALGFGGLAGTAAGAAKIVFVVGIILFLVSLFMGRKRP